MAKPAKYTTYEQELESRLKQYELTGAYKHLTKQERYELAEQKVKLSRLLRDLQIEDQFEDAEEKAYSTELAEKYFNDYVFEFVSDKNTLKQLIFLEVLNRRIQTSLNEFYTDAKSVPMQIMEGYHKNLMQIIELKKILGLTKEDKEASASEASQALDLLKKKFKAWRSQNQGSRTLICPHCSKMVMLKIKTEAWEAQKHPYFIDRFTGNLELFACHKEGLIPKARLSKILNVSEDYIDWILKKLSPNQVIKDIQSPNTSADASNLPADAPAERDNEKDEAIPVSDDIVDSSPITDKEKGSTE